MKPKMAYPSFDTKEQAELWIKKVRIRKYSLWYDDLCKCWVVACRNGTAGMEW